MPTSVPSNSWSAVASSADGTKLITVGGFSSFPIYYTSTNSGATWSQHSFGPEIFDTVASSADGTKLLVSYENFTSGTYHDGVYYSTNSGDSWTPAFSVAVPAGEPIPAVAVSADGNTFAASSPAVQVGEFTYESSVYISTNSGSSWSTHFPFVSQNFGGGPPGGPSWTSVTVSANGTKVAVAGFTQIGTSTNSGATTSIVPFNGAGLVASSADGSRLIVADVFGDGLINISTNWGLTWAQTGAPSNFWNSVAVSADGSKLAAVALQSSSSGLLNTPVYTSADSGATWSTNGSPSAAWSGIASSADGGTLVAVAGSTTNSNAGGGVYTLQSVPAPVMNLTTTGTNVVLSWVLPSTNFVLQQNPSLSTTNWLTLTNIPALDFTNLQNQVILPMTNGNDFYRLKVL